MRVVMDTNACMVKNCKFYCPIMHLKVLTHLKKCSNIHLVEIPNVVACDVWYPKQQPTGSFY